MYYLLYIQPFCIPYLDFSPTRRVTHLSVLIDLSFPSPQCSNRLSVSNPFSRAEGQRHSKGRVTVDARKGKEGSGRDKGKRGERIEGIYFTLECDATMHCPVHDPELTYSFIPRLTLPHLASPTSPPISPQSKDFKAQD